MKCANCGAEVPEGSLYCEKCGKDVHIVPDFTEFAEKKAEETVKNLVIDFDDEDADFGRSPEGANDTRPVRITEEHVKIKTNTKWIRFTLCAVFIMLLVFVSLYHINKYMGTEYILESAKKAASLGDRGRAIALLEGIDPKDSEDIDALLYLALLYDDVGDEIKYENLLIKLTGLPFATSEQNASAYDSLLGIYLKSGDYVSMADLLLTCNNVEVRDKYVDYCMMVPELELDPGYYGTDQLLKISVPGKAHIYYTLDGEEPDENSYEYDVPLLLKKGEYDIKVRSINNYGVWSTVTEGHYVIESEDVYQEIGPGK